MLKEHAGEMRLQNDDRELYGGWLDPTRSFGGESANACERRKYNFQSAKFDLQNVEKIVPSPRYIKL